MKAFTTDEVAEILKISRRTVLNEISRDNLRAKKVGSRYRITENALKEYMNEPELEEEE